MIADYNHRSPEYLADLRAEQRAYERAQRLEQEEYNNYYRRMRGRVVPAQQTVSPPVQSYQPVPSWHEDGSYHLTLQAQSPQSSSGAGSAVHSNPSVPASTEQP